EWLPYRAYLDDRQVFVNRDSLGFCLEVRPQSGADEEMTRVLTALYAASPPGTGIQFHLFASPAIRGPLARYAALRQPDDDVPEGTSGWWSAFRFRANLRISRASTICCSCVTAPGQPCMRQVFHQGPGRRPIWSIGSPR
ncbi:MAG: TraC family protein, partial [Betaproteobacteria bacterium]|nr:TraC family protein [Betaproteobacteria bacterium]